MHHSIAALVSSSMTGQQHMLAKVLSDVAAVLIKQLSNVDKKMDNKAAIDLYYCQKGNNIWETRIPTTYSLIWSLYARGKFAMIPNTPKPQVHVIGGHAYVSLKDCIADILAHGYELDVITPMTDGDTSVMSISQSARAQRILRNAERSHTNIKVLPLYLIEWSNGFEPSNSIKSNRGSCWIKTVTISPPSSKIHSGLYTYPIALGLDKQSHESVEKKFAEELLLFKNGNAMDFYRGGILKNVRVHLELLASLQDQPERRKANYIMLGRSSYTAQWGLALDFAALASGIPCCKHCMEKIIRDYTSNDAQCTQCAKWDTQVNSGLLDFTPPINYPTDLLPPSKKLSPKRITYETTMDTVATAHDGLVNNNWKVATLTDYLRVNGLNNEAVQSIKKCAIKCRKYRDAKQMHSEDAPSPEFLELEKEREKTRTICNVVISSNLAKRGAT
ncbi:MAG: hypothetical protein ACK51L_01875 [bacterium]